MWDRLGVRDPVQRRAGEWVGWALRIGMMMLLSPELLGGLHRLCQCLLN